MAAESHFSYFSDHQNTQEKAQQKAIRGDNKIEAT
jgi:hypothetical protein